MVHEPVEVSWRDGTGAEQTCTGFIKDYSRSGARIEIAQPLRVQTRLQVNVREQRLSASVKSCTRAPFGFTIGLEFAPDFEGILTVPRRTA